MQSIKSNLYNIWTKHNFFFYSHKLHRNLKVPKRGQRQQQRFHLERHSRQHSGGSGLQAALLQTVRQPVPVSVQPAADLLPSRNVNLQAAHQFIQDRLKPVRQAEDARL